jgi:hypothetical protein
MLSRIHIEHMGLIAVCCLLLTALPLPSCDENPAETEDYYTDLRISRVSGDGQSERVGAELADPLVVEVTNLLEDTQQGILVTFSSSAPGSHTFPPTDVTDKDGRAFCYFILGDEEGSQEVKAVIETDSTTFSATAVPLDCDEEDPSTSADWYSDRIYFVTTSSDLLTTGNSVLAEFNPETPDEPPTKILETSHILTDVAFSSRGELFVASSDYLYKVNAATKELEEYTDLNMVGHIELDANEGGILAGLSANGPFGVGCEAVTPLYEGISFINMRAENLTVDPVSRDLFFISGSSPTYKLYRVPWDGRSPASAMSLHADINITDTTPRGMCIDYSGNIYITVDGTDNYRRIIKVYPDGTVDYDFFDFYAYFGSLEAGRWGDITLMYGSLYIIDTDKNRIVEISTNGIFMSEVKSIDFSGPGTSGETYGITAQLQPPEATVNPSGTGPSRR